MKLDEMYSKETVEMTDKRYPDLRKFLKAAGYKMDVSKTQLNQGRKDELFTDAYIFEKDNDSVMVRPNSGTALNFDNYQWEPWIQHPTLRNIAEEMGLIGEDGTLDKKAFRRANLELFGE